MFASIDYRIGTVMAMNLPTPGAAGHHADGRVEADW